MHKKLILNVANTIVKLDNDAIVLIQSDHNWELSNEKSDIYGDEKIYLI